MAVRLIRCIHTAVVSHSVRECVCRLSGIHFVSVQCENAICGIHCEHYVCDYMRVCCKLHEYILMDFWTWAKMLMIRLIVCHSSLVCGMSIVIMSAWRPPVVRQHSLLFSVLPVWCWVSVLSKCWVLPLSEFQILCYCHIVDQWWVVTLHLK